MDKVIFKFNSITYAIKAKNLAERLGAKTRMTKNPSPQKGEGCGYSLTVFGDAEKVKNAFDMGKIKYTGYDAVK